MRYRHLPLLLCCIAGSGFADCLPAPVGLRDVQANSYYIDSQHSVIDPALKARNDAAVKPLNEFLRVVSDNADRFIANNDKASAQCGLGWLNRWAQDGAMLGVMASNQAQYQRKWMLAGLALAYLKMKSAAEPAQREHIEAWLTQLADASLAFVNSGRQQRNNHYYWVGLSVMATGVATGNAKHINAARDIYDAALADIRDDGSLPLELNRAGKALAYHNFALEPLVIIAELSRGMHEDWYGHQHGRLDRLARLVVGGIRDPAWFVARTGVEQEIPRGGSLGWSAFYGIARPQLASLMEPLQSQAPFRNARLGGNLSLLVEKHFFDRRD